MFWFLLIVFIFVCLFLCLIILIQSDKGGGISGAIGGLSGASNFLGTQDTANVLTKGTYIAGSVFLLLCALMTFFAPGRVATKSGLQRFVETQAVSSSPATAGLGMEFADDADANANAVGDGGPVIVGDIVEGGVVKQLNEDGVLVEKVVDE